MKIIDNNFESICLDDQKIFENELGQKIVETLHFHPELLKKIQSLQFSHASSRECWAEVEAYCYEKVRIRISFPHVRTFKYCQISLNLP